MKKLRPFEIHRDIRKHLGSGWLETFYDISDSHVRKICINPETPSGARSELDNALDLVQRFDAELEKEGLPHINNDIQHMFYPDHRVRCDRSIDEACVDMADKGARVFTEIRDALKDNNLDDDEKLRIRKKATALRLVLDEIEELAK